MVSRRLIHKQARIFSNDNHGTPAVKLPSVTEDFNLGQWSEGMFERIMKFRTGFLLLLVAAVLVSSWVIFGLIYLVLQLSYSAFKSNRYIGHILVFQVGTLFSKISSNYVNLQLMYILKVFLLF